MESIRQVIQSKRLLIIGLLMAAPVFRELFFGIISSHHVPFGSLEDVWHTAAEVLFMAAIGCAVLFIVIRLEKTTAVNALLDQLVAERTIELSLTQKTSIEALATLAEYRDTDTGFHLKRIQNFVKIIAEDLLYDSPYSEYLSGKPKYIEELVLASLLHDIGKIAIPNEILFKPGKLTEAEFETMKTHTTVAGELLERANKVFLDRVGRDSYLALARDIAHYHHERWDGTGYPKGLKAGEIPLSTRIVALCDVYDAVTTDRVYKKAWSHEKARQMLLENSGTHFDPVIVQSFRSLENEFNRIRQEFRD